MKYVIKADGTKNPYDRHRVMRTARNYGVPDDYVIEVAAEVERHLYDGIRTRDILRLIHTYARRYHPAVESRTNVRRAIGLLSPKPDFELYVRALLKGSGYEVEKGRILKGRCGEHEVDAIARKDGITYFVEVKHHHNHHRMTGLDEGRIARAIVEDVQEGYKEGRNHFTVDKAMIVCNTKLSSHAKRYAACWDIKHIGWDNPKDENIAAMVADRKLCPVTLIKGVNAKTRKKLIGGGIVTVGHLLEHSPERLSEKTGISETEMTLLVERARLVVK
ncbi:restriction endonuclease [Methanogenium organophilum]|uniref:Restriction endonuclease n=1 Tax=Methanogenium organophilum TaxID=2199 RepID=A0A9X9T9N5_METOG|nr:restriction endonuclease [Methanogenium organophilum]WAI02277.1 restriction endonuclease [Methanogenium organophilum]